MQKSDADATWCITQPFFALIIAKLFTRAIDILAKSVESIRQQILSEILLHFQQPKQVYELPLLSVWFALSQKLVSSIFS